MELIGIVIVALGFALRWNTLLVIMVGAIATGLVSGMTFSELMTLFGEFFIDSRYMAIGIVFILPLIGILERYGMKEQAEKMIHRAQGATTSRILLVYLFIRESLASIGLSIGGHAQMVRPLVAPMCETAAQTKYGICTKEMKDEIGAHAAAADNTGWFFGEDIFIATGAYLLMKGFFDANGVDVDLWDMAMWGIPTAVCAYLVCWYRFWRLEKRLAVMAKKANVA
ncbi:MAG: DUF969 domain-containing protein [Bacilli bacterium]